MPLAGRFWCTSSARPSPIRSFSTSDTRTMMMVFQTALLKVADLNKYSKFAKPIHWPTLPTTWSVNET